MSHGPQGERAPSRRAGAEIIVSHHKCSGRSNFGRMAETLPKFSEAMKQQQIKAEKLATRKYHAEQTRTQVAESRMMASVGSTIFGVS